MEEENYSRQMKKLLGIADDKKNVDPKLANRITLHDVYSSLMDDKAYTDSELEEEDYEKIYKIQNHQNNNIEQQNNNNAGQQNNNNAGEQQNDNNAVEQQNDNNAGEQQNNDAPNAVIQDVHNLEVDDSSIIMPNDKPIILYNGLIKAVINGTLVHINTNEGNAIGFSSGTIHCESGLTIVGDPRMILCLEERLSKDQYIKAILTTRNGETINCYIIPSDTNNPNQAPSHIVCTRETEHIYDEKNIQQLSLQLDIEKLMRNKEYQFDVASALYDALMEQQQSKKSMLNKKRYKSDDEPDNGQGGNGKGGVSGLDKINNKHMKIQ